MFPKSIFVKEFDTLEEAKEFVLKRKRQKKRAGIICRPNGPYKKEYKECQLLAGVTKPFGLCTTIANSPQDRRHSHTKIKTEGQDDEHE